MLVPEKWVSVPCQLVELFLTFLKFKSNNHILHRNRGHCALLVLQICLQYPLVVSSLLQCDFPVTLRFWEQILDTIFGIRRMEPFLYLAAVSVCESD